MKKMLLAGVAALSVLTASALWFASDWFEAPN